MNKCQFKFEQQVQNRYLNYLIDPSFQGVNRLFVLSCESKDDRNIDTNYFIPNLEIKDYNIIIDGKNLFDWQYKMI